MFFPWRVTPFIVIELVYLKCVPHSKDLDEVMTLLSSVSKSYITKCSGLNTQLVLMSWQDCSQAYNKALASYHMVDSPVTGSWKSLQNC